jgi:hypothetical protein
MGKKIALGVGLVVLILVAIVATRPATFVVERSTEIRAPAAVIYPHIASLRAMDAWSPWVKMDPQMRLTHEGSASGVGAVESWVGPQIGSGRMTITRVDPNREVEIALEFFEPMAATHRALFTLAPEGDITRVTWRMEGTNDFAGKAMSLVMDMDEMVGGPFAQGLGSLKTIAEAEARTPTLP